MGHCRGWRGRVLLALGLGWGLTGCRDESGPVRVGLVIALNEAGTVPMRLGAELAAKEINAAGGIRGRPLELVERDDHGSADTAVAIAGEFYDSDLSAVIGGAYSSLTLAAAPVYNGGRRPMVQLSPSASSPALTTAGDYTFRLCPSDLAYGATLARYAYLQGRRHAAIIYVNDEYGRGFRQTFTAEFQQLGGEVSETDPFLADSADVRAYLARLAKQRTADVVVLVANQAEGLEVLRQYRAAGLTLPVLAGDGMVGAERTNPALAEGLQVASGYIVGDAGPLNRRFVAAYTAAFPKAGPPDQGAAASYDSMQLLARVLGEVGTDRDRVRDALAAVGNRGPAYDGVVGRVAFDSLGDAPSLAVRVGVARGGVLVPAEKE